MNSRTIPLLIIVAIVSGAAGWFLHTPPAPENAPANTASSTVKPDTTSSAPATAMAVSSKAQVAAPAAAPAATHEAVSATSVASAAVSVSTPAAAAPATPGTTPPELTNVINEMTALAQSGDLVSVYENYMPPQKMAALTPEQKTFIEDQIRQQVQGPNGQSVLQTQQKMLQALSTVTPTMNEAGDHATFQVPTPAGIAPAGTNLPSTLPVNFVKIEGKWYIDQ